MGILRWRSIDLRLRHRIELGRGGRRGGLCDRQPRDLADSALSDRQVGWLWLDGVREENGARHGVHRRIGPGLVGFRGPSRAVRHRTRRRPAWPASRGRSVTPSSSGDAGPRPSARDAISWLSCLAEARPASSVRAAAASAWPGPLPSPQSSRAAGRMCNRGSGGECGDTYPPQGCDRPVAESLEDFGAASISPGGSSSDLR